MVILRFKAALDMDLKRSDNFDTGPRIIPPNTIAAGNSGELTFCY